MKNRKLLYTMALTIGILLPSQVSPWLHIRIPVCIQRIGHFIAQSMTAAKAHIPACIHSKTAKLAILATVTAGIIGSLAKKRWPLSGATQHLVEAKQHLDQAQRQQAESNQLIARTRLTCTQAEQTLASMQAQCESTQTSLATVTQERDIARQTAQQALENLRALMTEHESLLKEKVLLQEEIQEAETRLDEQEEAHRQEYADIAATIQEYKGLLAGLTQTVATLTMRVQAIQATGQEGTL